MTKINIFSNSTEFTNFKKGEIIFCEGDHGELAYAVKDGEVVIKIGEQIIDHVLPGGIFGEMALIDKGPRSASVVATTDCQLVPLTERQFTLLIHLNP